MSVESEQVGDSWRDVRETVLERDGHECRFCGTTNEEHLEEHGRGLEAHHILPEADGGPDRPSNLITGCISCHRTLESTHAKAVRTLQENGVSKQNIRAVRDRLKEMEGECRWLWRDELPRLSDLPRIENRDLPGYGSPVDMEGLTDREKTCYLLGRLNAYAHAGTSIEAALEYDGQPGTFARDESELDEPVRAFWAPANEREPEFYSNDGW